MILTWLKFYLFRLSPVWSPQYLVHRIESVQKNFLLLALRRLNWNANRILPPYSSRLFQIHLPSLTNRRTMLGKVLICKLIPGEVESSDFVSRLNFSVPSRFTRNYLPLFLNHCRSNYELTLTEFYALTIINFILLSVILTLWRS